MIAALMGTGAGPALGVCLLALVVPAVVAAQGGAIQGGPTRDAGLAGSTAVHVEIDAAASGADAAWDRVVASVGRAEPVDVTVWFAFGSIRLRAKARPRGGSQLDLELEQEGDVRAFSCVLPAGTPFRFDPLGRPAARKQSPPLDLPPELSRHCTPASRR